MSADNYFLIRRDGPRFVVSMGFASDDGDPIARRFHHRFDTWDEAEDYASMQFTEYGVQDKTDVDVSTPEYRREAAATLRQQRNFMRRCQ